MNEKQQNKIKEEFEKGNYDAILYIVDNDLININLTNYNEFCKEVINILNSVRINRDIREQEKFYPYEEVFASKFYTSIYRALERHEVVEISDEVLKDLAYYYGMIKNIGSIGAMGDEYEKAK